MMGVGSFFSYAILFPIPILHSLPDHLPILPITVYTHVIGDNNRIYSIFFDLLRGCPSVQNDKKKIILYLFFIP